MLNEYTKNYIGKNYQKVADFVEGKSQEDHIRLFDVFIALDEFIYQRVYDALREASKPYAEKYNLDGVRFYNVFDIDEAYSWRDAEVDKIGDAYAEDDPSYERELNKTISELPEEAFQSALDTLNRKIYDTYVDKFSNFLAEKERKNALRLPNDNYKRKATIRKIKEATGWREPLYLDKSTSEPYFLAWKHCTPQDVVDIYKLTGIRCKLTNNNRLMVPFGDINE